MIYLHRKGKLCVDGNVAVGMIVDQNDPGAVLYTILLRLFALALYFFGVVSLVREKSVASPLLLFFRFVAQALQP